VVTFLELFEVPAVEDAVGTAGMEVLAVAGTVVAGTAVAAAETTVEAAETAVAIAGGLDVERIAVLEYGSSTSAPAGC
jgi:hypothetical protein